MYRSFRSVWRITTSFPRTKVAEKVA